MSSALDLASELISAFREAPPESPPEPIPWSRPDRAELGGTLSFPDRPGRERVDLLATLHARRSTRFFGPGPITAELLTNVIARGIDDDAATWEQEQLRNPLEVDVVTFRVSGLQPGMYTLDAPTLAYAMVAALPPPQQLSAMTIQREFCDAAAIITVAGDLERAAHTHGAHGYRLLMGRAGAAAYTMWLEGVSCGLVGTVFAGFIPASVRLPLHCDGASRHQLFALAVGATANPSDVAGGMGHR
jgi:hypothetical protein